MIRLDVHGDPAGKARPRFTRATGRVYTPAPTVRAEQRVQLAWIDAGKPTVDGPVTLRCEAILARPATHWRKDGTLSREGLRQPVPTRKPDVDNHLKLVCDALNGLAYVDDKFIVEATALKRWANPDEAAHTIVTIDAAVIAPLEAVTA